MAHEDASAKKAPQNQTNVNSDVVNTPAAPVASPPQPPPAQPFTPAQMAAMQQAFAAMLAPHLKPRVQQPPVDAPKGT